KKEGSKEQHLSPERNGPALIHVQASELLLKEVPNIGSRDISLCADLTIGFFSTSEKRAQHLFFTYFVALLLGKFCAVDDKLGTKLDKLPAKPVLDVVIAKERKVLIHEVWI